MKAVQRLEQTTRFDETTNDRIKTLNELKTNLGVVHGRRMTVDPRMQSPHNDVGMQIIRQQVRRSMFHVGVKNGVSSNQSIGWRRLGSESKRKRVEYIVKGVKFKLYD